MELFEVQKRKTLDALNKYKDGKELNKEENRLVKQKLVEERKKLASNKKMSLPALINNLESEVQATDQQQGLKKKHKKMRRRNQKERLKKMQRNFYERES